MLKRSWGLVSVCLSALLVLWATTAKAEPDAPLNWVFLAGQFDNVWLPKTDAACMSTSEYKCYYGDGVQRVVGSPATPNTVFAEPGGVDPTTGKRVGAGEAGGAVGTVRLMLGFDRVFLDNFSGGLRLGVALGESPSGQPKGVKSYSPIYAELGIGYWLGSEPFANKGFRPFVRLAGGMVQIQRKRLSPIIDMRQDTLNPNMVQPAAGSNPTVAVWENAGGLFGSLSLGTMFAIAPNHGPLLELKGIVLFPDSATGVGVQLGYGAGF